MPKHSKSNPMISTQLFAFYHEKHHRCGHQNSSDVQIQILKSSFNNSKAINRGFSEAYQYTFFQRLETD